MAEQLYGLTKADLGLLMEMIQERKNRLQQVNTQNRAGDQSVDHQEVFAPETYVAFTPVGGIPAMVGTGAVPGFADCNIYRAIGGVLEQVTFLVRTVYNLSESAVDGLSWVVVVRDKFGTWYAIPTAVGGSGASLTVQATPGTAHVYPNISILEFVTASGFLVTQPSTGVAEIDLTPPGVVNSNISLTNIYGCTRTYASIGASFPFTIPSAGVYLLIASVVGQIQATNDVITIEARFFNVTSSAQVGVPTVAAYANSPGAAPISSLQAGPLVTTVTLAAGDQIDIQAKYSRVLSTTPLANILPPTGAPSAGTYASYVKIG